MGVLNFDLVSRSVKYLNDDPFFKENVRFYNFILCLECEEDRYYYNVSDGKITVLDANDDLRADVVISGNQENWGKIIDGMQGGMHRAFRHKMLHFSGNPAIMLSVWKTIWRIGEALTKANEEETHAV